MIITKGLRALKARDLAAKTDYSAGTIYNAFPDLHHFAPAFKSRTFRRLSAQVSGAMAALEGLFDHIRRPVAKLRPDLCAEDVALLVRDPLPSIHGIVWLGLQKVNFGSATQ